ncbi:hypothetical protein PTKIN_Ptkin12aG0081500 [Pterospermum kingtungense]
MFMFRALLVFSFLVALLQLGAMRPLVDELVLQSLQKGPVTGSDHNPCTNIPGSETGVCKLGGMNVAGNVMHTPAIPSAAAEFGMATTAKGTHDQLKSS